MTKTKTNSTPNQFRANRFRLSRWSILASCLVTVVWALIAIPGDTPTMESYLGNEYVGHRAHGWPMVHMRTLYSRPNAIWEPEQGEAFEYQQKKEALRTKFKDSTFELLFAAPRPKLGDRSKSFWSKIAAWDLFSENVVRKTNYHALAINVGILMATIVLLVTLIEFRVRRGGGRSFGIRELLGFILAFSILSAWSVFQIEKAKQERKTVQRLRLLLGFENPIDTSVSEGGFNGTPFGLIPMRYDLYETAQRESVIPLAIQRLIDGETNAAWLERIGFERVVKVDMTELPSNEISESNAMEIGDCLNRLKRLSSLNVSISKSTSSIFGSGWYPGIRTISVAPPFDCQNELSQIHFDWDWIANFPNLETLWITNFYFDKKQDFNGQRPVDAIQALLDRITNPDKLTTLHIHEDFKEGLDLRRFKNLEPKWFSFLLS